MPGAVQFKLGSPASLSSDLATSSELLAGRPAFTEPVTQKFAPSDILMHRLGQ